ncbi:YneF family protein [Mycoplasma sp. Mirounga ES2805-ORL]|uniref:YneF family protein n=1 Tax=Mycoplasma sp. Mirounga ES2805-ORL TaxID=754514 RepID=UPI00197B5EC8|nr:YneF family protein [Mycoplasma sp. Mirounga ES2805-ORL]QSF13431.1 YneF family protein [Mycoplasma sp. Mirounga ES2805-ORL]
MSLGAWIGICIAVGIVCILAGGFIGFIWARKSFEKQIKENPPITEKMIRAMFLQMGRKASESQIKAVMRSMQGEK